MINELVVKTKKMKIKEIRVEKLFDIFDHTIEFKEGGITLLHGENGFGKTTLLRMIKALFNGDIVFFKAIVFKSLSVLFSNGEEWKLTKIVGNNFFEILLENSNSKPNSKIYLKESEDGNNISNFKRGEFHWLTQYKKNNTTILIDIERLNTWENYDEEKQQAYSVAGDYVKTIILYSSEIVTQISEKLNKFEELGNKFNSSPERFLKVKITDFILLENNLSNLKNKKEFLYNLGLLNKNEAKHVDYTGDEDDYAKRILTAYVKDNTKKLEIFDDISKKIELFLTIINKRFLYKKLTIDRKRGFVVFSELTQKEVPLTGLSSGEQHEIILLFTLLFKTKENTLILMDEPEISLHISWQNDFVEDLQKIIKLVDLKMLIATHSPSIIGNNWDLAVELEEIKN